MLIDKNDCKSSCKTKVSFKNEYEYCREFCGFNKSKINDNGQIENCNDLELIFKQDICWNKKAIKEKKDKYCEEISNEGLSDLCKNRVLEEIIK